MIMTPRMRKFFLTTHVTSSIGWVGALAVFLAHAIVSLTSQDDRVVRGMLLAMDVTAWFVILPLSLTSFSTGIIQAVGTTWGLVKHYWVLFKLLLTAFATIILLLKLGPISEMASRAGAATTLNHSDLKGVQASMVLHSIGGLIVLLTAATLAIYKPQGLVRPGRSGSGAAAAVAGSTSTAMPGWVKAFLILIGIGVLLLGMMLHLGGHGPHAHMG